MGIARYEEAQVYNLTFATSAYGDTVITKTLKFESKPEIKEVKNDLRITDKYRLYAGVINLVFNYTPFTRDMYDNQNLYSIIWRGNDWRIDSAVESNDRMKVTFLCYRNDPSTQV
jgi:hypothetical protein